MQQPRFSVTGRIILLLLLVLLLVGCSVSDNPASKPEGEPLPNDPLDADATTVVLLGTDRLDAYRAGRTLLCADPPDVRAIAETLRACPALQTVDARSSGLTPAQIAQLRTLLDGVAVVETVKLCGQTYDSNIASLTLTCSDLSQLSGALSRFTNLQALTVSEPALTPDELRNLLTDHPGLQVLCSVDLHGAVVSVDSTALDLSGFSGEEAADILSLFPACQTLTLGDCSPLTVRQLLDERPGLAVTYQFLGQTVSAQTTEFDLTGTDAWTAETLEALLDTAPQLHDVRIDCPSEAQQAALAACSPRERGVVLHGTLTLLDCTFDADAETIDFADRKITDEETQQLEAALPLFANLKEIDLFESTLGQETMDALFDAHPDLFFGWTFTMWNGFYTVRSDITAFTADIGLPGTHRWQLTEEDYRNLRYCRNMLALDFGHSGVEHLEFLRNWPHLKILILADTCVHDLTVLAELKELEYLELFLTTPDSYEPLSHLEHLIDLNLCHTRKPGKQFRDDEEVLTLTNIKSLERLWIAGSLTAEQAQMMREGLPGVQFDFYSTHSTDHGWRKHPRYFIMRNCFINRSYIPFD